MELVKMTKTVVLKKMTVSFVIIIVIILSCLLNFVVFAAKPVKDITPPTTPTNLSVASISSTSIALKWSASTDNVGVKQYNVYKNGNYVGYSSTTSYTVSGLTPATTYSFYIIAQDASGNLSSQSNTLTVTTSQSSVTPTPTPVPTATPAPTATPTPVPTAIPSPTPTPSANPTRIVGYYASWAAYSGFTPDKIDGSRLTHINYAFANIGTDLKIAVGDTSIDPSNFAKLNELKQVYPNLKTLISVGGWSWSGKFSDVAYTDASRAAFADSCVQFIKQYGFDGVDIDWEYPVSGGLSTNVRRPEDKHNFTLLLQKIREKLDAQEQIDGKHYLLTIAGGDGSWYVTNTELGILNQYLDYGNIMTYDIHGSWDGYTDFNAPLYNNTDTSPQYKWSVDSAIKSWLNAGFPASKLVVGVPFYGYKYTSVVNANNGLYQTFGSSSSITYASVAANYLNAPGYVRYFHSQSMVPWLFNGSTFITYEDEQSMAYKAQYIKNGAYGGAMIWELSQDPNRILLNALYNGLK
jgi:chitinase